MTDEVQKAPEITLLKSEIEAAAARVAERADILIGCIIRENLPRVVMLEFDAGETHEKDDRTRFIVHRSCDGKRFGRR